MPKLFFDFHLHSRYSRATSHDITVQTLERAAIQKGLNILGTGDFTHPLWLKELKENLTEIDKTGIYHTKTGFRFVLSTEISNIYSQGGKLRKIHNVLLAPNFDIVDQVNEFLKKYGNLEADGRPIFGSMSCPELVEGLMQISKDILIVPAHCWTPWFAIFGSKSGFDSVEECFQDQSKHIYALETGMSSDPAMNWRLSRLDKYTLVSNSDAHSANIVKLGRELNVLDIEEVSYNSICDAIRKKDRDRFLYTIEVHPEFGKYHWDGHRLCKVLIKPSDAIRYKNICPVCRRPLTIGVEHRVEELADRPEGFVPKDAIPFKKMIPLVDVIAGVYNTQTFSKKVMEESFRLIKRFGSELNVLIQAPEEQLKEMTHEKVVRAIIKNRMGEIKIIPGYDGVYGRPIFEAEATIKTSEFNGRSPQKRLDMF